MKTNFAEREFNLFITNKEDFPISFLYGGVFHKGLAGFEITNREDFTQAEKRLVNTTYLHPDKLLQITVCSAYYANYDAYEWTVWFENVGRENTLVLSEVWATDLRFKGQNPVIKGNLGDHNGHFTPFAKNINETPALFDAYTGRSAEQFLPYFNIETEEGGVVMAIGWPGTWQAKFEKCDGGTHVLATGIPELNTYLKPSEKIRTALMAFVRYYSKNEDEAINKWRRWFIDCNMPYEDAQKTHKVPPVSTVGLLSDTPEGWYRGGSEFENSTTWERSYKTLVERNLMFDYHWFDAGWYLDPSGKSLPDSWFSVGTWALDKNKWPNDSIKTYFDAMKKGLGVKGTLMWFETERFNGDLNKLNKAFGINPDWLIFAYDFNFLVWHGNEEAVDWIFNQVTSVMQSCGVAVYREDHNFSPITAFKAGDRAQGKNRNGITENLHFQGKFKLWQRIIDWQVKTGRPAFVEMQSAGGNRQDLALLRYSVSFWRSDSDIVLNPPGTVTKINTLNKWIPFGGTLFGKVVDTEDTNPRDKYQWRAAYSSNLCVPLQFQNLNEDTWQLLKWGLEEFNKYKEYLYYDFYELTPWKPIECEDQWCARMYYDKTLKKGVLETFNFPQTNQSSKIIKLRGLDANQYYSLTDPDGLNGNACIKGSQLMEGYQINLQPRSSSILWIDPIEDKKGC